MTDLQALLDRVKKAEGADRELDRELMALTYVWGERYIGVTCWDDRDGMCCPGARHIDRVWIDPATDKWRTNAIDGLEFTSSLDTALALVERAIPDAYWLLGRGKTRPDEPLFGIKLMRSTDTHALAMTEHDSAPLAVIAALLAALIAAEAQPTEGAGR